MKAIWQIAFGIFFGQLLWNAFKALMFAFTFEGLVKVFG